MGTLPQDRSGGLTTGASTRNAPGGLQRGKTFLAYAGCLFFIFAYLTQPSQWVPGLAAFPFARVAGSLVLLGLGLAIVIAPRGTLRLPREMIVFLLFFGQLCFSMVFAFWHRGSFDVLFGEFWKVVLITLVIALTASTLARLQGLLFLQTVCITVLAIFTALGYGLAPVGDLDRMGSPVRGAFENPNDFAWLIAMAFPFCLAFMLLTRRWIWKLAWGLSLCFLTYSVVLTASRSGLLVLVVAGGIAGWEYTVRQRKPHVLALVILAIAGILLTSDLGRLSDRMASIFEKERDESAARSTWTREYVLKRSLMMTLENPLTGVGPGNFRWAANFPIIPHNTYTQLSSEGGIPALALYIWLLVLSFRNLGAATRAAPAGASGKKEIQILASALRGSLMAFVVGAFFAGVAYELISYLFIAYSSAFRRAAETVEADANDAELAVMTAKVENGAVARFG